MYKCKHFRIEELVPPGLFNQHMDNPDILWMLFDDRELRTVDAVREYFGKPVTINNWLSGGQFQQRGFRTDVGTGATFSQHRYGRATDKDVEGVTAEEARQEIMKHKERFPLINRMEEGVSWLHTDCGNTGQVGIVLFGSGK